MKLLALFMAVICFSFPAFSGETAKGEVLAILRTPQGMSLTEESLKNGEIRKYIDLTAASADARVVSIFDSLSLVNKKGNIFVFIASDKMTSEELASELKKNPSVVSASPNRKVYLH